MSSRKKKILFYYLSAFSHTGGIEKFNRCFIKALNRLPEENFDSSIVSVYDSNSDERYNRRLPFKGFKKRRSVSLGYIFSRSFNTDVLILGHINLAIAGVIYKLLRPGGKLIIVAHGIEAWPRLYLFKKLCFRLADQVLSVSNYTKNQLVLRNNINPQKIRLFPNTIDPFFALPQSFEKPGYLMERYGITNSQKIILTLSRLSINEKEKGYSKVIAALPEILKSQPNVVYILAGKYDQHEKKRIELLLAQYKMEKNVILTGYVKDEEISDLYKLADVFIMPSRKEGFGIVFLEALASGTSVIGGNQDGTVDALLNGSLGMLINPTKIDEITSAILQHLQGQNQNPEQLQKGVLEQYRFSRYQQRLQQCLDLV